MRPAAAHVAFHRVENILLAGMRILLNKRRAGHDHAGDAVAALHSAMVDEGLLHGMESPVMFESFNSGDFVPCGLADRRDTGPRGDAVDHHGASAALAFAASIFGACQ